MHKSLRDLVTKDVKHKFSHYYKVMGEGTAMTDKLPIDDSVTAEYLAWLESNHPRHGLGGNVAWNAGVAFGKSQAVREAVPEGKAYTQFLTDVVTAAGLLEHGRQCKPLAKRIAEKAFELNRAYYQIAAAKEAK